jgi:ABC-2 type transport system permease protein
MNSLTTVLVLRELHLNRWLIAGAILAGLFSVYVASTSSLGYNIGALMWLTVIVATGVILPMYGIQQERKDRSLLFALSLPLSGADYARAKMLGVLLCFFIPWLVLSLAAVVFVVALPATPDGMLPIVVLICGFLLANFSLVLCGALLTTSEALNGAIVIATNMCVTLFVFIVGGTPAINRHIRDAVPVWNEAVWAVLVIEAVVLTFALVLPLLVISRRRTFI